MPPAEVATKSDLAELRGELATTKSDVAELAAATRSELAGLRSDMIGGHGELRAGLTAVNQRLDRLFLTLLVGMFGVVGALVGLVFTIG